MSKIEKIKIVSDAACRVKNAHVKGRDSRGESACGIIILNENNSVIKEDGIFLGVMTNQQAEYNGLIKALEMASEFCNTDVEVWMDVENVVKQMKGENAVKSANMKPLYEKVKDLEKLFRKIEYFHHKRTEWWAQRADRLAKEELNKKDG